MCKRFLFELIEQNVSFEYFIAWFTISICNYLLIWYTGRLLIIPLYCYFLLCNVNTLLTVTIKCSRRHLYLIRCCINYCNVVIRYIVILLTCLLTYKLRSQLCFCNFLDSMSFIVSVICNSPVFWSAALFYTFLCVFDFIIKYFPKTT